MKLSAITPPPLSVVDLFTRHPECWGKRHMYVNENDNCTLKQNASKCCLMGAIEFVYGEGEIESPYLAKIYAHVDGISHFNDSAESVDEIIELARKANV